jgi:hypothetical protein
MQLIDQNITEKSYNDSKTSFYTHKIMKGQHSNYYHELNKILDCIDYLRNESHFPDLRT